MSIFDHNNNNSEDKDNSQKKAANLNGSGELRTWRAKVDCIYQGAYIFAGSTVLAEDMTNTNFELAQA
jgi:hypothetical protein